MIQNLTVDSGFSQNIINNNPLLESLDEAIWRADRNELSGLLIEVETMEPREATSTDITPLVEMSSEQEMVFEEQGLSRFSENVLSMLSGAAIVGTGVSMYNINKNHNASRRVWSNMDMADINLANLTGKNTDWVRDTKASRIRELRIQDELAIQRSEKPASRPQDADFDRLFQDSIQEHRINSGDHTTRKIEDILAKHQVDIAQRPLSEDAALERLLQDVTGDRIKTNGKRNTPKFKKAAAKASFPRTGGGVLLGLDMIHIIRSVVEADTKDLTDGWEGPWIQEFFKGLGTMAIGGEESLDVLQNATMKDLVWYTGALTGINPSATLEILKQIPKSIKDVSVAMIIDPLAWAVSGIPEGHPMNSIQGQSTPMGQYPPQVWE